MSKDPPIGILLGIVASILIVIIVWFSGLLAPETQIALTENLETAPYIGQMTRAVTQSEIFRSLQKAANTIKDSNILRALHSDENLLTATEIAKWQRQALALGIKNPTIQSISLSPNQQFASTTQIQGKRTVKIQCTIVSLEQEKLVVEIEAWVDGGKTRGEKNYIFEPLSPGKVFDLMKNSRIRGVAAIRLAILSRPANDRLIIAMDGLATNNAS